MCEQTPIEYKDGDTVWVKLGPCWWPGEVKDLDSLPTEVISSFKKRPIAAVKFFQEDSFEFVKNLNHIYSYNCKKKNEFIKKGLAEERTGGDPNIINSPAFAPEKKTNYAALIFGSSPKKSPKGLADKKKKSAKNSPSLNSSSSSTGGKRPSLPNITHPRFLGKDDHEVRILVQSPESSSTVEENEKVYSCTTCGFTTPRVDVVVLHNKSHIQGNYSTPISTIKKGKKSPAKKEKRKGIRMTHSKTSSIDEDLALLEKGLPLPVGSEGDDDDESGEEPKVKRRRKMKSSGKSKKRKSETKQDAKVDIRTNLLAEWDDEESDENDKTNDQSELEKSREDSKTETESEKENKVNESEKENNVNEAVKENQQKVSNTSCFDFDEEDEVVDLPSSTSFGKAQRQRKDENNITNSLLEDSDTIKKQLENLKNEAMYHKNFSADTFRKETTPETENNAACEKEIIPEKENNSSFEKERSQSPKEKLSKEEESGNSELQTSRHMEKEILENLQTEVSNGIITNSKEKLETVENTQEKENCTKNESKDSSEKHSGGGPTLETIQELLESTTVPKLPDLPHISSKSEQNFHFAKLKKIPDKEEPSLLSENSKAQTKASLEVITKHTNPKKRFVKTFEDSELNEKKKAEAIEKTKTEVVEKEFSVKSTLEAENMEYNKNEKLGERSKNISDTSDKDASKGCSDNKTEEERSSEDSSPKKLNDSAGSKVAKSAPSQAVISEGKEKPGLEVLKLKSQLMLKLAESGEKEKEQQLVLPKYKKFEFKRSPRKVPSERKTEKRNTDKKAAEPAAVTITTSPVEKSETEKSVTKTQDTNLAESISKNTESSFVKPIKLEKGLSKKHVTNMYPSVSKNSETTVIKSIEIVPKHHGEVEFTVAKLENSNAMMKPGEKDFVNKKYFYSRRQGRYSVKRTEIKIGQGFKKETIGTVKPPLKEDYPKDDKVLDVGNKETKKPESLSTEFIHESNIELPVITPLKDNGSLTDEKDSNKHSELLQSPNPAEEIFSARMRDRPISTDKFNVTNEDASLKLSTEAQITIKEEESSREEPSLLFPSKADGFINDKSETLKSNEASEASKKAMKEIASLIQDWQESPMESDSNEETSITDNCVKNVEIDGVDVNKNVNLEEQIKLPEKLDETKDELAEYEKKEEKVTEDTGSDKKLEEKVPVKNEIPDKRKSKRSSKRTKDHKRKEHKHAKIVANDNSEPSKPQDNKPDILLNDNQERDSAILQQEKLPEATNLFVGRDIPELQLESDQLTERIRDGSHKEDIKKSKTCDNILETETVSGEKEANLDLNRNDEERENILLPEIAQNATENVTNELKVSLPSNKTEPEDSKSKDTLESSEMSKGIKLSEFLIEERNQSKEIEVQQEETEEMPTKTSGIEMDEYHPKEDFDLKEGEDIDKSKENTNETVKSTEECSDKTYQFKDNEGEFKEEEEFKDQEEFKEKEEFEEKKKENEEKKEENEEKKEESEKEEEFKEKEEECKEEEEFKEKEDKYRGSLNDECLEEKTPKKENSESEVSKTEEQIQETQSHLNETFERKDFDHTLNNDGPIGKHNMETETLLKQSVTHMLEELSDKDKQFAEATVAKDEDMKELDSAKVLKTPENDVSNKMITDDIGDRGNSSVDLAEQKVMHTSDEMIVDDIKETKDSLSDETEQKVEHTSNEMVVDYFKDANNSLANMSVQKVEHASNVTCIDDAENAGLLAVKAEQETEQTTGEKTKFEVTDNKIEQSTDEKIDFEATDKTTEQSTDEKTEFEVIDNKIEQSTDERIEFGATDKTTEQSTDEKTEFEMTDNKIEQSTDERIEFGATDKTTEQSTDEKTEFEMTDKKIEQSTNEKTVSEATDNKNDTKIDEEFSLTGNLNITGEAKTKELDKSPKTQYEEESVAQMEESVKQSNNEKTGEVATENLELIEENELKNSSNNKDEIKKKIQDESFNNLEQKEAAERAKEIASNVFISTEDDKNGMMSALSTLAAVSELSPPLEEQSSLEKIKSIETNLTVVSETDLEDGQVEIVNAPESKPVTLTSFSVDFTEPIKESENVEIKHKPHLESSNTEIPPEELPGAIKEGQKKLKSPTSETKEDNCDVEAQIPSLIVCNKENTVQVCRVKEKEEDEAMSSSKLLEILTDNSKKSSTDESHSLPTASTATKVQTSIVPKEASLRSDFKNSKYMVKSAITERRISGPKQTKPVILTEKIIKPVTESETVSVQKVTSKRTLQDIEDIDAFIIQKPTKKIASESDGTLKSQVLSNTPTITKKTAMAPKGRGKAKILQQTIITPSGDVIQPTVTQVQNEESMFDINSMPIVLGDQILTPETIENMPVVISEASSSTTSKTPPERGVLVRKSASQQPKILNKIAGTTTSQPTIIRTYASAQKLAKGQKNYQVASSRIIKSSTGTVSQPGKQGKFIIVPTSSVSSNSKPVIGKRPLLKQTTGSLVMPASSDISEPVGNKIMIVTNQQGQQQRVLLTPAQQKMLGYQAPGTKLTKATIKSNIMAKSSKTVISTVASATSNSPNIVSQTAVNSKTQQVVTGNQNFITSGGQILVPISQTKQKGIKPDISKMGKKVQLQPQRVRLQEGNSPKATGGPTQKTIVIKNQQGQIVKKIQGTDDALLEQQVAEQVQAIKASSSFSGLKNQVKSETVYKTPTKAPVRRSYPKKLITSEPIAHKSTAASVTQVQQGIPPLAPISAATKKLDSHATAAKTDEMNAEAPLVSTEDKPKPEQQRPLNQLIIQDALGNQTTITEGQILALPSETVDGQPQSYMLVTLDESGNLTPLNNEALLSLDPNLGIGGDLSNMVLQIDDRAGTTAVSAGTLLDKKEKINTDKSKTEPLKPQSAGEQTSKMLTSATQSEHVSVGTRPTEVAASVPTLSMPAIETSQIASDTNQTITCNVNTDSNQQLIISGDPISTQKFIESLTEGNPDLANLLASAEGNILIHTDGQQILINTESENQLLLPINAEHAMPIESTEGGGNPIFATQSNKSQDILAAALADTDVFQQDQPTVQSKLPQSQLSPNSTLFPMNVGNVLETSLTLSSPIMTPLEVPSSNSKKIPDEESDILTTEVPKNVDLPITITDPNISQTVAQQQVATLMASELQNNLDLPLSIAEQGASVSSTGMNSPSYVYSLPTLDDTVEINQKPFSTSISMPLLNEETEVAPPKTDKLAENKDKANGETVEEQKIASESPKDSSGKNMQVSDLPVGSAFMSSIEGGLCTLGGEMCSSLSEPPPDMFDLSSNYLSSGETKRNDKSIPEPQPSDVDDNSSHVRSEENVSSNLEEEGINIADATFQSEVPKRNFLSENSVLESSSPVTNMDENSSEIPVQPQIVADLPAEIERDSSSTENSISSETENSIPDSSKRKDNEENIAPNQKKARMD